MLKKKTIIFHFFRYLFYLQQSSSGDEQYNWQGLLIYYSRFAWENGIIYIYYTRAGNNRLRRRFLTCGDEKWLSRNPYRPFHLSCDRRQPIKSIHALHEKDILLLLLILYHYYKQCYISLLHRKRKSVGVGTCVLYSDRYPYSLLYVWTISVVSNKCFYHDNDDDDDDTRGAGYRLSSRYRF